MGKGTDISKKRNLGDQIKDIPVSKRSGLYKFVIVLLISSIIWLPLLINVIITGSFIGIEAPVNEEDHIGFYQVRVYALNTSGEYEQVNANFTTLSYYTEAPLGNNTTDVTYETTNATIAFIQWVNSSEGLSYPNRSFLIYTNESSSTPNINYVYLDFIGRPSEFDPQIIKIGDGSYGDYTPAAFTDANTTLQLNIKNTGNGTFGEQWYIPSGYRLNETILNGGLWLKINTNLISLRVDSEDFWEGIDWWLDGSGNTYILISYYISAKREIVRTFEFEFSTIPTTFTFIEGEWNGVTVGTIV